ncbi:MAG: phosphatase PAP2 family protein [bacterium]
MVCSLRFAVMAQTDSVAHSVPADSLSVFTPQPNTVSRAEYLPAWHEMFTRVPGDWGRFAVDNFRVEKIPAIAGLAGLTAALVLSDHETWRATSNFSNATSGRRSFKEFCVEMGDGRSVLGLAGGFAILGWATADNRALSTASQIVESYLSCGITVQLLKHIAGRERPERQSSNSGRWRPLPNQAEYHRAVPRYDSFPSGHTAAAMAAVTVVIENYPEERWLRPVGYGIVALVGFGLVSKGWHWYSDLPLAIALGHQFGKIAAHPIGVAETAGLPQPAKIMVAPAMSSNGAGISVAVLF